jgi:hypothetical protein
VGFGCWFGDLPSDQLQAGARILFTLLWQEGWEGNDFQVEIAAPIKPEKRYEKSKLATDLISHKSIR